jgi:hypothetical protein
VVTIYAGGGPRLVCGDVQGAIFDMDATGPGSPDQLVAG